MGIPAYENNPKTGVRMLDTISQLGIISKATRCPQSDIILYFHGI